MITLRDQVHALVNSLDGWTPIEKADALFDLVMTTKPKLIMEIGVWGGKSLFAMALAAKANDNACRVIAVDPWSADDSAAGQIDQANEEWWRAADHNSIFNKFRYQVNKLGLDDMVQIHRVKSNDMPPVKELDILHIDGNHGPDAVDDVERFVPSVKLGGYVILDDLRWIGGYVGLAEKQIIAMGFYKASGNEDWGIYKRVESNAPKMADKPAHISSPLPTIEQAMDAQLTVAFITSREKPLVRAFLESLKATGVKPAEIIIVSLHDLIEDDEKACSEARQVFQSVNRVAPKPNVWQGEHKLTAEDWWAVSNARNTAFCLCRTDWIACLDDRCVLMPGWADSVRAAMRGNYVVCGSYQKRHGMQAKDGLIIHGGTIVGEDHRFIQRPTGVKECPADWTFGCNFALPIDWAMEVNGFDESFDGMGFEDCFFGRMLMNCGHPIKFDPQMRVIQDRTPVDLGAAMLRMDKGVSPNDKSHAAVLKFSPLKRTIHAWNLSDIRKKILSGGNFPTPQSISDNWEWKDWYDGQLIADFKRP